MELLPVMGKAPSGERLERIQRSGHYEDGKFLNQVPTVTLKKGTPILPLMWKAMRKPANTVPLAPLPSVRTDLGHLPDGAPVIVWFGHSSYLIKLAGKTILVDPVFSGHAAPIPGFAKAFPGANVYGVVDMPDIDILIITHDHYDHLDYHTIRQLAPKVRHIYTSLGVGSHLEYWGIGKQRFTEMDWEDQATVEGGGVLTAMPARHFSGRGAGAARTLWSSFVLQMGGYTIYLGGDSGYGPHFKEIGRRWGPIDLAILECGQYGESWPDIHMVPEETAAAAVKLGAKLLLPVHWAKFSLAMHPWDEPIKRVVAAAKTAGIRVTTPMIGEPLILGRSEPHQAWWEARS